MIEIWGIPVNSTVLDIIHTLRIELHNAGIPLLKDIRPQGTENLIFTCITHKNGSEHKPSCGVSTKVVKNAQGEFIPAGTVHCFTCGYSGDLPKLISDAFGYNDQGMYGYKWIIQRFAAISIERRQDLTLDMGRDGTDTSPTQNVVTEEDLEKYRFTHSYMYERGLNDKFITAFDVGYDKETDSLTFPVRDRSGILLFVQKRAVKKKKFDNANASMKSATLYGIDKVYQYAHKIERVAVVESIIDTILLWQWGQPAVALMGASPSAAQIHLLRTMPGREVLLALDNPNIDEAGAKGAAKLIEHLNRFKLIYTLDYGVDQPKDIGSMTQEYYQNHTLPKLFGVL